MSKIPPKKGVERIEQMDFMPRQKALAAAFLASTALVAPAMAQPANDLIDNAIVLAPGPGSLSGTTTGATTDTGAPTTGTGVTSPGVWYTFGGTGGTVTFDTFAPTFTYDTKLHSYAGYDGSSLTSLTALAANDDAPGGGSGLQSEIAFATTTGEQYWVLVSGFGGATGDFTLNWTDAAALGPVIPLESILLANLAAGSNAATRLVILNARGVARTRAQDSLATRDAVLSFTRTADPESGSISVTQSTMDSAQMMGGLYTWIDLTGFRAEDDGTARSYTGRGLQIGADFEVMPDMVVGLSLGVSDLDTSVGTVGQDGVLRYLQPYLAYRSGAWFGEASLIHGWGDYTQTSIGGSGEGETRLTAITFDGGYDIALDQGVTVTPMLGLVHGVERIEGVSGTLAGAGKETVRFTQASLGGEVSQSLGSGEVFAGLHADWLNTNSDTALVSDLLVDDGWTGRVELGLSTEIGSGISLDTSVVLSGLGGDLRSTSGALNFAFRF